MGQADARPGSLTTRDGTDAVTQRERAAAAILKRIVTLELRPGAGLTEGDAARHHGLGKAVAREALILLSGAGYVTVRAGTGYTVAPVSLTGARLVLRHLSVLAADSAGALAKRPVPANVQNSLQGCAAQIHAPAADEFPTALFLVHLARGVDPAAPARLMEFINELERLVRLTAELEEDAARPWPQVTELVDAIVAGDSDAARQLADAWMGALAARIDSALLNSALLQEVNLTGDVG